MRKPFHIKKMLPLFLGLFTFVLTRIAIHNPTTTESLYSQKLYPIIAQILSKFSNLFPFSLDDLLYIVLILVLLTTSLLVLIKKYKFSRFLIFLFNTIALIFTSFYLLWGFNYFRSDINQRLGLLEQEVNTKAFVSVLDEMISATNQSYCTFEDTPPKTLDSLIEHSYSLCAPALQLSYPAGKREDKKISFSRFFAKAGISGYYGPFFNEVHVNKNVLPVEYPFVLAHEKAHQFGITSEAEANFYAWLVCTQSPSKQLQYSANLHILRFFLYQAYSLEEYPDFIKKLDKKVILDFQRIRENWQSLRNEKVDKVASKVNDTYLKTNKVEKGIDDYRGVVKFVMDFSQDSVFQETHNLNFN